MATPPPVRMVGGMAASRSPARPPAPPWGGAGRHPSRPRGNGRSANSQVLGALLVLGGAAWLLQQTGLLELSATTMLSILLITLGVGMVLTARSAGGGGLVVLGLVLTVVLASATAVDVGLLQRGVGERTFTPTSASALDDPFQLGVGSLTVDLTELDPEELAGADVEVDVGVGELVLLLPPSSVVPVDLVAEARAGEVDLIGQATSHDDGPNVRRVLVDPAGAGVERLEVDLDVGLGTIQVVRAPSA